jgi:hypothetical protein
MVLDGLSDLGFDSGTIARDYEFADFTGGRAQVRRIPLAAFSSYPPTYRNACAGLVFREAPYREEEFVFQHRSLGAPLLLEAFDDQFQPWAIGPEQAKRIGSPVPIDQSAAFFNEHRTQWSPESLGRIKALGEVKANRQLDFFDTGLLPVLSEFFQTKLKDLLERTFTATAMCYQHIHGAEASIEYLFPYLFRFVTAKIFMDRADAEGWDDLPSARAVLEKAETHSGSGLLAKLPDSYLHEDVLNEAWSGISQSFHFQNLSVPDLAFIYESTFINDATRRELGVHSTPVGLAEYIVQQLPWDEIPIDERRIFEPFSGHGIFLACAMERLRDDLNPNLTPRQRHDYFRRMLVGVEQDPLAIEVCRLVLTLSDYPNSNSWQLHQADVFNWPEWNQKLAASSVVLSNPPYESFSPEQRLAAGALKTTPPSEMLRRIMSNPPAMLGLVLPQSFLSSPIYQDANREIARRYGEVAIVELPELFRYADNETVALLASNRRTEGNSVSIRYSEVPRDGVDAFFKDFHVTRQRARIVAVPENRQSFSLWISAEDELWDRLVHLPKLDSFVEIRKGVNWIPRTDGQPRTAPRTDVVSDDELDGFHRGAEKMASNLAQFQLKHLRYLSLRQEHQDPKTRAYKHPWQKRKVVCNAARFKRKSPWRIAAWADAEGLAFSKEFFAIWPVEGVSEFALAGILCSPIANAFSLRHDLERHNHISTLRQLPVPSIAHLQPDGVLDKQCRQLQAMLQVDQPNADRVIEQLLRLDAAVLNAYGLPDRVQRQLLDQFQGWRRPVAVDFESYFPDHFSDVISLRDLVTIQYDWETANDRRCDLIDKELFDKLTTDERIELDHLQLLADLLVRLKAPYPNDQLERFISRLKAEGKWTDST